MDVAIAYFMSFFSFHVPNNRTQTYTSVYITLSTTSLLSLNRVGDVAFLVILFPFPTSFSPIGMKLSTSMGIQQKSLSMNGPNSVMAFLTNLVLAEMICIPIITKSMDKLCPLVRLMF